MNKLKISFRKFLRFLYVELVKINDTPQRVALGLGIGVFFGIMPAMGPLAAVFTASIFKANRASALIGSLLTNTWISFVTFLVSIKLGSFIMGIDWQIVKNEWYLLFKDFHFSTLLKASLLQTILPIMTGYLVLAVFFGFLSYLATLLFFSIRKRLFRRS